MDGERKSGVKKTQIKTKEKPKKKKSKRRDDDSDDADTSDAEDEISRGDKVEAKCTGWTKYYSGEVTKVNRDGTYDIRFVDGERKSGVKKTQIKTKEIPKESDMSAFRKKSNVGVKSRGNSRRKKYYKGQTVMVSNSDGRFTKEASIKKVNVDGTYDVLYRSSGERELQLPSHRIKEKGGGSLKSSGRSGLSSLEPLGELEEVEEDEVEDAW